MEEVLFVFFKRVFWFLCAKFKKKLWCEKGQAECEFHSKASTYQSRKESTVI
jgi:hypothetical protein